MQDGQQGGAAVAGDLGCTDEFARLLAEARAGSGQAIGALLLPHHDCLVRRAERVLCRSLRARVTAEDVVQDAFLHAHIHFPAFRGNSPLELGGWMRQLLKWSIQNAARRHRQAMRHVQRQVSLDSSRVGPHALVADDSTVSQRVIRQERDEELERAIGQLPEKHRTVVLLRHRDNRGFAEVAAALFISENAARKLWTRAVERLRRELKRCS